MRVAISHETVYRYRSPANYSVQYLRLTPLSGPAQRVLNWKVSAQGTLSSWTDGFGNAGHTLVVDGPHDEVLITAEGEVDIADAGPSLLPETDTHPPALFLRSTKLTQPDDRVIRFSQSFKADADRDTRQGLDALMTGIRETVKYTPGVTTVATPARQALERKAGVCQDHAQLFVTCCRALGVPARYVSGYLCSDEGHGTQMASHAWAEAWIDGTGWCSYDVTNAKTTTDAHVRLAVGLDSLDAAPVRGFRRGGSGEEMTVEVAVGDIRTVRQARELARQEQQQQ